MAQYWVTRGGVRRGPYEEAEILEAVELGTVRHSDLLWVEGMREGIPVADVFAQLGAGAPATAASHAPLTLAPLEPPHASPYRPPSARVDDLAELALGNIRYAGFWIRYAAAVLDALVMLVPAIVLALGLGLIAHLAGARANTVQWYAFAAGILLNWLYFAVLESSPRCATPGKRAFHLQVFEAGGLTRIGFLRATVRWLGRWLSMLVLLAGYLMQPFTPRKRALHDFVAGTVVISTAPASGWLLALVLILSLAPFVIGFLLGADLAAILGR